MAENSLRVRIRLDVLDKALGALKNISQGSKETAATLKAAREQLKQLNETQKTVGKFTETRRGLSETEAKLQAANEKVRQLATTMGSAGPPTKAMAQQFAAARTEASKLGAQFTAERQRVQQLRDKLSEAGISTKNLASHDQQLRASIATTTANIQRQTEALKRQGDEQRKLARIQQQSAKAAAIGGGMVAAGAVGVYAGKRTVQTAVKPVQSYMAHEDAMLGIARQVPGARDDAGQLTAVYSDIEAQVRELSKHVPLATTQIAEMFTAAARMEVPTDKLSEFVLMASEMATAFDAVPDEITESMGKVAKNFKIELTNIRGLADAINYLDDNAISKGADIIDYLNRTSGVLATVAMSERNAAALGSTLLTLGERAETASTATNAIISKFAAATKGTKKFQSAVKEIGLSSQAIETGMTKDATGTLMKVMEAVRKAPEAKRMGIMVELVGMEHSDTLAKLVDKPEELRRQIDLANSKQADGSMAREASARNQTLSAQGKMTDNRVFNLKAVIGENLKSEIQKLLTVVNPLLERFTAWVQANPALVGGVLKAAIVFGVLMAGVSALLIPLGLLIAKGMLMRFVFARIASWVVGSGGAMSLLQGGVARLAGGFGLLVRWGSALFRLNPFAALAAGLFGFIQSITQNWGKIKAAFSAGDWSSIGGFILKGLEAGLNMATLGLYGFLKGVLTGLIKAAKWVLGIQSPSTVFAEMGGFLIEGLIVGMRNLLGALWGFVSGVFNGFVSWLGGLWAGIEAMTGEVWGRIVATVSNLLNMGVGEWMQVFLNFSPFGLIWNALTSALALLGVQVPEQFRSFGGWIIDGLIGGITSKLGQLRDTVVGAATSASQWFKEKLGINSPSRVFTQYGGWISEGAALGIEGGQSAVRAAALAMAASAMVPVGAGAADAGPGFAPSSMIAASGSALSPRAVMASAPAMGGNTYAITINPAPGMDPQAIARAVAAELDRRELAKGSRKRSSLSDTD